MSNLLLRFIKFKIFFHIKTLVHFIIFIINLEDLLDY